MKGSMDSIGDLVAQYAAAAAAHGAASESCNSEEANKQADIVAKVYRQLRARGPEAQLGLLGLLEDPDPSVRCWAATHALEFAPERGEPVLRQLARGNPGFVRADASASLQVWREGKLRFP